MKDTPNARPLVDFSTKRLLVQHWAPTLDNGEQRDLLVKALIALLTPLVLEHLPPSLQVEQTEDSVSLWINDRAAESEVYLVTSHQKKALVGLLILVNDSRLEVTTRVHIGYLLSQLEWGKGYASELVAGLVAEARAEAPMTLIGGVTRGNTASAHILRKYGFTMHSELSDDDADVFAVSFKKA